MKWSILLLGCLVFISCKNKTGITSESNDWNSGKIVIASDTNLRSVLDQMKPVYENSYPDAVVDFNYSNEEDIVRDFINGKVRVMIISRSLLETERQQSASVQQINEVREHIFAYDAIAVISCKQFRDSVIALEQIPGFLQENSAIKMVFDNAYSGIAKQVMSVCNIHAEAFKNAYVVKNPQAVIDYVANDPQAIGFIPFNFISNSYLETNVVNRQKIKLLAISVHDTAYSLSQNDIAYSNYPFKRPLNIVIGNNPDPVGRGFTNFMHRRQAAKILLKSGLVPVNIPVRNVTVHDELKTQ
jgi:phosphate transport system substrate-binding protein